MNRTIFYWHWRLMLIALLLAGEYGAAFAQSTNVIFAPAPDWVQPAGWQFPAGMSGTNAASDGTRCLLYERQEFHEKREDFTRLVLLMENEAGVQDSGSLTFGFNPSFQQLIIHSVRIHRAGEALNRLDPAKLKVIQPERDLGDHQLNGRQSAVVFVEDLRVGDALEYSYTTRGGNPIFGDHYASAFTVQSGVPVNRQRLRIVWDAARPLHLRSHLVNVEPAIQPWGAGREYTWDFTNLTAISHEDHLPARFEPYPYFEASDFNSWKQVVDWALPLYAVATTNMPVALRELIRGWEARGTSVEDRARLALQFVQDDLRYTGLELGPDSHRPAPPFETFEKRFGDCKGKSVLLCAILKAMNIEAHPALVNTSARESLSHQLPSPFSFDHVIVKITLPGAEVWVDPTLSYQGGPLHERYVLPYGWGLVLREGVSDLEKIPASRAPRRQKVTSVIRMNDYESPAAFTVTTTYFGAAADSMREELARKERNEMEKDYLNFYARYYPGIEAGGAIQVNDDRDDNRLIVKERYSIRDLWTRDDSGAKWEADFYPENLFDILSEPDTRLRKYPLRITYPLQREQEIEVHLPETDWDISTLEKSIDHPAFSFRYRREFSGAVMRLHYSCETKLSEVSAEGTAEYLKKVDEMEELLGDSLERPVATAESSGAELNWLMVIIAGFGVVSTTIGSIWLWRRSVRATIELPPPTPEELKLRGIGGWLILVALGLFLRPILYVVSLWSGWDGYLAIETWQAVAMPQGSDYHPLWGPLLVFEMLGMIALTGLSCVAIALFLGKRAAFPRFFIVLLAINVAYLALDDLGIRIVKRFADPDIKSIRDLIRAGASSAIWILYMRRSRRVKATFVR